MFPDQGYYWLMRRLIKGSILATIAVLGLIFICVSTAGAQINGVPASVSSIGFGGDFGRPPGVPPSVTSIGPAGLVPNRTFITQSPFVPTQPHPPLFPHHHHRNNGPFGGNVLVYPVPYGVPYAVPVAVPAESQDYENDQYNGGPTIFDRRGPGTAAQPAYAPQSQPESQTQVVASAPAATSNDTTSDQPPTVLVFKDGHQVETQNYAIIGDTLYDMTPGHSRKVPLSELDLNATAQQNEDRGTDFKVPTT